MKKAISYHFSSLIGIAAGMVLNFGLNHTWTFRGQSSREHFNWLSLGRKRLADGLMLSQIPQRWGIVIVTLLTAALGLRVAAMARVPLVPEEAYYWMYSQHPSLSYFDHPPMVAWLIGSGTQVFGNTEFGVRVGGALLMLAASGVMYVFGRMWFGREPALLAALLLQALPVYFCSGLIATMDSALVFFWLVCLLGVSVALRHQRAWGWYLAGLGLGGAMLSKYTGVFLGLGALLAVLGHPAWRRHLHSVHPYAASLLAFAMFTPVLIWNGQHEWASFRFQFADRFAGKTFSAANLTSFALLQLAVATPPLLIGLGWLYVRTFRNRRRLLTQRQLLAWCFSVPLLLVMGYKSFRYDICLNWTMPLYLSALPAVAQLGLAQWRLVRRGFGWFAWVRTAPATIVGCLGLDVLMLLYLLTLQPQVGWISALGPWRELAAKVEAVEDRFEAQWAHEPLIVVADKYRLASVLAFYRTQLEQDVRTSNFTTSQWILGGRGLGYAYWANKDQWIGHDCVVVAEGNDVEKYASQFREFQLVDEFRLNHRTYQIGIGRGLCD
jgi:dolichol-phosphate mannosyltransferase